MACSDSINPDGHSYWLRPGAGDEQFATTSAASGPGPPAPVQSGRASTRTAISGPFNRPTAKPGLVLGNRFDPATRYEGAQIVHDLLPESSLLTVEGWGHTSFLLSLCADETVSRYLLDGTTPPEGATCTQDVAPFEAVEGAAAGSAQRLRGRQRARTEAMAQIAPPALR